MNNKICLLVLLVSILLCGCSQEDFCVAEIGKGSVEFAIMDEQTKGMMKKTTWESAINNVAFVLFKSSYEFVGSQVVKKPSISSTLNPTYPKATFDGLRPGNYHIVAVANINWMRTGDEMDYWDLVYSISDYYTGYDTPFILFGEMDVELAAGDNGTEIIPIGHCVARIDVNDIKKSGDYLANYTITLQEIYILGAYSGGYYNGEGAYWQSFESGEIYELTYWDGMLEMWDPTFSNYFYKSFKKTTITTSGISTGGSIIPVHPGTGGETIIDPFDPFQPFVPGDGGSIEEALNAAAATFYTHPTQDDGEETPTPYLVIYTTAHNTVTGVDKEWYYRIPLKGYPVNLEADNEYGFDITLTGPGADTPIEDPPRSRNINITFSVNDFTTGGMTQKVEI